MKNLLLAIFLTLSTVCSAGTAEFKSLDQLKAQIELGQPFVVLFSASWCGPCQAFHPTYEKLSNEVSVPFFTIDVDNPAMQAQQIPAIPLVLVMKKKGNQVQMCGALEGNAPHDEALKGIMECLTKLK